MNIEDQKKSYSDAVVRAEAMQHVRQTSGWEYIRTHLDLVCETLKEALTEEKNETEIIRLQERYRAFNTVVELVENGADLYQYSVDELNKVIEFEDYKTQYGIDK